MMAAGAFARIVLLWGSMARLAIRVVGVIEDSHHPAADLVAVGADALIVITRCILGVAIGAFAVEVMGVINLTPVPTRVVTAAAILALSKSAPTRGRTCRSCVDAVHQSRGQ